MKKNFICNNNTQFCVEITKSKSKYYNKYVLTIHGEQTSGRVPKYWDCERIAHYWIREDFTEVA